VFVQFPSSTFDLNCITRRSVVSVLGFSLGYTVAKTVQNWAGSASNLPEYSMGLPNGLGSSLLL
jgi:hypothetical protein